MVKFGLYQVTFNGLCFGFMAAAGGENKIHSAPPISKWMLGKSLVEVVEYWFNRGAEVRKIIRGKGRLVYITSNSLFNKSVTFI